MPPAGAIEGVPRPEGSGCEVIMGSMHLQQTNEGGQPALPPAALHDAELT